jgi:hypothetical protein
MFFGKFFKKFSKTGCSREFFENFWPLGLESGHAGPLGVRDKGLLVGKGEQKKFKKFLQPKNFVDLEFLWKGVLEAYR